VAPLVDRDVFDLRLARLEELLRRLRKLAEVDRASFLDDPALQAQAERWMQVAGELCLDLAQHLIASRGWQTPATYREAFQTLRTEGVLSSELAARMEGWAGLRNLLVHLYLDVDHGRLFQILTEELGEIEDYAAMLAQVLPAEAEE
jgi:uncharacterized protein YutE (UPF0331/DUF86 family)